MFVSEADADHATLKQGDIVSNVHMVGSLSLEHLGISRDATGKELNWQVLQAPDYRDVAVLSHSCEVSIANGVKLTSVILAPIRDINGATQPDKVQSLIDSNILVPGTQGSFLKYFYLPANDKLQAAQGAVVDFSKCFSVRKNSYNHLLSKKILEMQPQIREAFALKLALYFHRSQQPAAVPAPGAAAA